MINHTRKIQHARGEPALSRKKSDSESTIVGDQFVRECHRFQHYPAGSGFTRGHCAAPWEYCLKLETLCRSSTRYRPLWRPLQGIETLCRSSTRYRFMSATGKCRRVYQHIQYSKPLYKECTKYERTYPMAKLRAACTPVVM